jgi:hypothetical protein
LSDLPFVFDNKDFHLVEPALGKSGD